MSDIGSADHRYRTDATFRAVVDFIRRGIRDCHYTPSEVREAAFLAMYMEEMQRPYPDETLLIRMEGLIREVHYVPRREPPRETPSEAAGLCSYCGHPRNSSTCQASHP